MIEYHQRAIICNHVFEATRPVLLVVHSSDNEWQLLCGEGHPDETDQYKVAGIGHLLDRDPSLAELLDLPAGHSAERNSPGSTWVRAEYTE